MEKNVQVKERDINIELLRVIAMFMIVAIHAIGHSGLFLSHDLSVYNKVLIRFLDSLVTVGSSLFILISGYYMIGKKLNLKKILNLWGKTILYSVAIYIIFLLLDKKVYTFETIFPVLTEKYWFITAYITLYFLAPIINIGLNKLTKNQFKYLIIVFLILMCFVRIFFNIGGIFSGSILPVILIYCIGAYIGKHAQIDKNKKYFTKYLLISVILTLVYFIIELVLPILVTFPNSLTLSICQEFSRVLPQVRDIISILVVAMSTLLFMKFLTIKIKPGKFSKFITYIAPSMFSVYILHENIHMRTMWEQFGLMNFSHSFMLVPYLLLLIFLVFTICVIIDLIRRWTYKIIKKIPFINKLVDNLNSKLKLLNDRINNFIS